jgi:hypothetical protein
LSFAFFQLLKSDFWSFISLFVIYNFKDIAHQFYLLKKNIRLFVAVSSTNIVAHT